MLADFQNSYILRLSTQLAAKRLTISHHIY